MSGALLVGASASTAPKRSCSTTRARVAEASGRSIKQLKCRRLGGLEPIRPSDVFGPDSGTWRARVEAFARAASGSGRSQRERLCDTSAVRHPAGHATWLSSKNVEYAAPSG